MKKRTFLLAPLALLAGTLPAFARDDLGNINKGILERFEDELSASLMLAYANSVISTIKSGNYTTNSLMVAYANLTAMKRVAGNKSGGSWDLVNQRLDEAISAVARAYADATVGADITKDLKENEGLIKDESISPDIGSVPIKD